MRIKDFIRYAKVFEKYIDYLEYYDGEIVIEDNWNYKKENNSLFLKFDFDEYALSSNDDSVKEYTPEEIKEKILIHKKNNIENIKEDLKDLKKQQKTAKMLIRFFK